MIRNLAISTLLGLLVAAFMMSAAWQHNSQGEIHSDGIIDWNSWLMIGVSWSVPVFFASCIFSLLVLGFRSHARIKIEEVDQGGDGSAD